MICRPGALLIPNKWWPASVTLRVQRLKRPLLHFKACRPKWCSRQDSHPHCRRSQRRVSAGWTTRAKLEPPDGDAPSGFLYKRNPQAAARRRLASLTGFAPVISCLRGRRVGWTTPQGQKMVRASGNAPEPGTHLVRHGL